MVRSSHGNKAELGGELRNLVRYLFSHMNSHMTNPTRQCQSEVVLFQDLVENKTKVSVCASSLGLSSLSVAKRFVANQYTYCRLHSRLQSCKSGSNLLMANVWPLAVIVD